jgi:hypothetical protein
VTNDKKVLTERLETNEMQASQRHFQNSSNLISAMCYAWFDALTDVISFRCDEIHDSKHKSK